MNTSSGRLAVMRESSWRTDPAAQLRGLANSGCAAGGALVVDFLERRTRQIHFAAHFEIRAADASCSASGTVRTVFRLVGDVLALRAVAARRADLEAAAGVAQADGQAIDFGLDREVAHLVAGQAGDALVPGPQRVGRERVGQAEHRHAVLDDRELRGRPGADALRRRIR